MKKVFGIGLSRTGTTSLYKAMKKLGYSSVHYPNSSVTSKSLIKYMNGESGTITMPEADSRDFLCDSPVCVAFKELDRQYPGSKFIFTVRETDSWVRSMQKMLRSRYMSDRLAQKIANYLYGQDRDLVRAYVNYETMVCDYFREHPDDLLVWNLCAEPKWEILCGFLNKPVPDRPFPHAHKGDLDGKR